MLRYTLLLIFTASGFAGLIYESIWTHYLKLFLGHAAYAQTLVLAIFMGGMALGAAWCSHASPRWRNTLRRYALVEGIVGLCALIFHPLYTGFMELAYAKVLVDINTPLAINLFKWGSAALFILPQSMLLGMTFPLMSAALIRRFPQAPGGTLAILYFTNSIGAAIGVLASGFVLIPQLGLPGTIITAGIINLLLAAVVWKLSTAAEILPGANALAQSIPQHTLVRRDREPGYRVFLLIALITGLASFIYEIGWIRMLSMVLGSSTHAFELMLSAFITGLALGGLWIKRRIDTLVHPTRFLAWVQLVMGGLALSTLPLYNNTFELMQWLIQNLDRTDEGYRLFNLASHTLALGVMLPTTFCAGMTLPLITFLLLRQGHGEKSIGGVYAANTVGAIGGIMLAVHLALPWLGLKGLITLGAGFDILLGLLLLWWICPGRRQPLTASLAGAVAVMLTLLLVELDPVKMASGVYRSGRLLPADAMEFLYRQDGKTASVSVSRSPSGVVTISTNGKPDASINLRPGGHKQGDENTMVLLGALPLAYHPAARRVANIGMGSGLTTHTLLSAPWLEQVDTIEIEPAMIQGAKNFMPRTARAFDDPRSRIHIEDAKTFFSSHNQRYDIIISEPSNPWVSGISGLFSSEFYHHVKRYLNEDGLLVQWLQIYEIDMPLVASVLKALSDNFSDYVIYACNNGDVVIVARANGRLGRPDPRIFAVAALTDELGSIQIPNLTALELHRIGSRQLLEPLFRSYGLRDNSDYYPVLDHLAPRTRFLNHSAHELIRLGQSLIPITDILDTPQLQQSVTSEPPHRPPLDNDYDKSTHYSLALMMLDYHQGENWEWNDEIFRMPGNVREQARLARLALSDCNHGLPLNSWLDATYNNLAKRMLPYLSPAQSAPLWRTVLDASCWSQLHPLQQDFLALYIAVAERNATAMAATARRILANIGTVTPGLMEYLLAAAMTGELASGNRQGALELWQRYGAQIPQGEQLGLQMRLLWAHSAAL